MTKKNKKNCKKTKINTQKQYRSTTKKSVHFLFNFFKIRPIHFFACNSGHVCKKIKIC